MVFCSVDKSFGLWVNWCDAETIFAIPTISETRFHKGDKHTESFALYMLRALD